MSSNRLKRLRSALSTETDGVRGGDSSLVAVLVFAAVEVIAAPLYLSTARHQWFFLDEWDFLSHRTAWNLGDLFRPHNEHWQTLPILWYRLLWNLFGLRTYIPYQLTTILLHLLAAILLRVIMRRAGVGPWIATIAAGSFALFVSGSQDIFWGFQVGFDASLVFGLVALLVNDHDGPVDRRDWLALGAGLLALLCSGVGVTMVFVVALAAFLRRGLRPAAFQAVPLAFVYLVWFLGSGHRGYSPVQPSVGHIAHFMWTAVSATFAALGGFPGLGLALGAFLVLGLWWARRSLRGPAASCIALLAGAILFLAISAFGRAGVLGPSAGRSERYLHLSAALSLPAIAFAIDAVVRRLRILGALALVALVLGSVGNVQLLHSWTRHHGYTLGSKSLTLTYPLVPAASEVPRSTVVGRFQSATDGPTIGWLLDGVREGRVPPPSRIDPAIADLAERNLRAAARAGDVRARQGRGGGVKSGSPHRGQIWLAR